MLVTPVPLTAASLAAAAGDDTVCRFWPLREVGLGNGAPSARIGDLGGGIDGNAFATFDDASGSALPAAGLAAAR